MHVEAYGQTIPRDNVGEDLVDLVAAGRDIIAYVADVSGHGLPAAVLMGMVKTAVRYGLHLGQALPVLSRRPEPRTASRQRAKHVRHSRRLAI